MHLTQLANVQYQYYYLFYIKNKYVKTNCEIKCHQYRGVCKISQGILGIAYISRVVGRERIGTAFPHKKLSGNGVLTREFFRNIFILLLLH